jgi:hypothetical protein
MHKVKRKHRLLAKHPYCYFCGGIAHATTVDHVPPKACFPDGYWPEEFEFPACEKCNYGTAKSDLIFGFYSMLLDFNQANRSQADIAKLNRLRATIAKRYPESFPNALDARPIYVVNGLFTPSPVAIETGMPAAFREAVASIGQKLTHALYYREMGKAISSQLHFVTGCYQPQNSATATLTRFFEELLPDFTVAGRSNIKSYGERFAYKSGVKEKEDFFVYAAQFGKGLILWGIVSGTSELKNVGGPLRNMPWRKGACGAGSANYCS